MSASTPARGRPRSETSRQAILAAAYEIVATRGYAAMTIEQVADAAGAGKATVYRWWAGKADLAVAAFFASTEPELRFPDTGSAREDFRVQIVELANFLRGSRGRVLAAMLGGARGDPELASALGRRWRTPRRQWGYARITRAVAAGECWPGIDLAAALGALYGPLYTPLLFDEDVPSAAQVDAHLALVLPAVFRD